MRILHLGDQLPDVRVERFMLLDSQLGHKSSFIGQINDPLVTALNIGEMIQTYSLEINRFFRLGYHSKDNYKKLNEALVHFDPDFIHVHNIYFLKFLLRFFKKAKLSLPLVYNDHEYWSETNYLRFKGFKSSLRLRKAASSYYKAYLYRKWENKFIPGQAVVTVSGEIKKIHKIKYAAKFATFIPNMPIIDELKQATFFEKSEEKTTIYIGRDFSIKDVPSRYTGDFLETWKKRKPAKLIVIGDRTIQSDETIESTGVIPHMMLYTYSSRAHFGLLAYNQHYFHKYISPNKIYIYIHAGALPVLPRDVPFEVDVPRFANKTDFFEILEHHPLPDADEVRNLAKDTLIANNFIERLKQAYEEAMVVN